MAQTSIADVTDQIQKFWGAMFMKQLREMHVLPSLVNKDYQGDLKQYGDTVRVSQINAPAGELRTVGVDADAFDSEELSTSYVDVKADKRAVAAYEFEDLVQIQSQIGAQDSEVRDALMFAIGKQINSYLYSLVSPSAAAPDHIINGVTDFNASQLIGVHKLASQAKWLKTKGWYVLVDPSYKADLLAAQTLTSGDYVNDAPVIGGQIVTQRFGMNIIEDNSAGLAALSSTGEDVAVAFSPDFMHLVMQSQPTFKISDMHAQKKFGYVMSVDVIFGAKLGIDGAKKHIKVYNT